jgi:NAD+ diphosphatase
MMSFTGNPLDRASDRRTDPAWIAARKADSTSLVLPVWQLKMLLDGHRAGFLPGGDWEGDGLCVFLGLREDRALFARQMTDAEEPLQGHGTFTDMRAAAHVLPGADTAILGQARVLIDWHTRHRFCPNCGALTGMADGGYRRLCPSCGAEHFPRTDPVVIMLPVLGDQCLIGRNARFPDGLYSAFAGYIEPGESIAEAVARELAEEASVKISDVTYHASQPWPFPSSLMIGCFAQAASRDFAIDGKEITDARWMSRDEVRARLAGEIQDGIVMPGKIAIAHALIRDWADR